MVFGTFEVIHPGHVYFLEEAKKQGDFLIVLVSRDETVEKVKGRKPVFSAEERASVVKSLKIVDKVILGDPVDYYKRVIEEKPEVICLGYDQLAFTEGLKEKLAERGLEVTVVRIEGQ